MAVEAVTMPAANPAIASRLQSNALGRSSLASVLLQTMRYAEGFTVSGE